MNKREFTECLVFAGLRLLAVALLLAGGLGSLFALADAWYRFDPNYLGDFLRATLLRPGAILLTGVILFLGARRCAARMARAFAGTPS
jgi:hypothetical protein